MLPHGVGKRKGGGISSYIFWLFFAICTLAWLIPTSLNSDASNLGHMAHILSRGVGVVGRGASLAAGAVRNMSGESRCHYHVYGRRYTQRELLYSPTNMLQIAYLELDIIGTYLLDAAVERGYIDRYHSELIS